MLLKQAALGAPSWHTPQATATSDFQQFPKSRMPRCRYKFTAEDVQRMVEEKRQRSGRNTAAERTRLARQMNYAKEQGDLEEAARCRPRRPACGPSITKTLAQL